VTNKGAKRPGLLRTPAFIFNVALIAFFLVFLITALSYSHTAGMVPILVATLGLMLSAVSLAGEAFPKLGRRLEAGYFTTMKAPAGRNAEETLSEYSVKALAIFLGWAFGSFVVILLFGFIIGTPVSVFVYAKWARKISWAKSFLMALGIYVFTHLVLGMAMGLILFRGILFGALIT
jgi:hypothetical protein